MSKEEIERLKSEVTKLELEKKLKKLRKNKKPSSKKPLKDNTSLEIKKLYEKKQELSKKEKKGFFGKLTGFAQQAQLNKEINIRKKSLGLKKATSQTRNYIEYLKQQEEMQNIKSRIKEKQKQQAKQLKEDMFKPHKAINNDDIFN